MLPIREFAKNLSNIAGSEEGFSYEEIMDKLNKTCDYLMFLNGGTFVQLTTERRFKFIFEGTERNEEEKIYISQEGFNKWVKNPK